MTAFLISGFCRGSRGMTASRNSPGTAEISLNSILQKMSLLPSESQGSSHVLWDRCEFHLGTFLFLAKFHFARSQTRLTAPRLVIELPVRTFQNEIWERGMRQVQ